MKQASTQSKTQNVRNIPKPPIRPYKELREQAERLSDIGRMKNGTLDEILVEIQKALTPIRYLKEAAIDYQDDLDHFVVVGYLSLFLAHMDDIVANLAMVAPRTEHADHHAA